MSQSSEPLRAFDPLATHHFTRYSTPPTFPTSPEGRSLLGASLPKMAARSHP
ncbi:hypothetical protein BDZ89DRAFT_1064419 [Hymenopellis radicata]|nr:hypothetical protein BDZ89DRAFT_1064419 [Hymenopellis radicata]